MFIKKNNHTTLVNTFKKGSLISIITTAVLISIIIIYLEVNTFKFRTAQLKAEYKTSKKEYIKQEVLRVTEYISQKKINIRAKTEEQIKHRTYEAHAIATNIYNKFYGELPDKKIKKLIVEVLRPLRFFNDSGYYFIHSLDGVLQLHAKRPELEGTSRLNLKSSSGENIVKNLFKIIKTKGEGFSSYKYSSFDKSKKEKTKYTYVRHFKPFNWSIGSGDYLENIEKNIQKEILKHVEHINFDEDSYIFVVDYDGNRLIHSRQQNIIGTNISNIEDLNGVNIFKEQRKAARNPDGNFIYYTWNKPTTSIPTQKMTFTKSVPEWRWIIGTGVYLDDINNIIQQQLTILKNNLIQRAFYIFLIAIISIIFIMHISNKFTHRFTSELGLFLSFFTNASVKVKKININSLQFIEFRNLAVFANRMLDKRVEIEKSLRTSEEALKQSQKITHLGSWEYDIKNNKLHWSDEIFRIFELDPKTTIPSYDIFMSLVHSDDKVFVDTTYRTSIKNKTPYDVEHRICLSNGNIKYIREHAETYFDKDGHALSSSGTVQDVTEIKEKEDQLRRTQKMDALGKLTGGIAHDYNNMMGVVLGYSDLLLSHPDNDEKTTKYLKQIYAAGERARELTTKLMAFSRYKPSETEIININEQLQRQQQLLDKTLTARIKLSLNLDKELWLTKIDPGDFNDTIINMTINASHAIEISGTVTISSYNTQLNTHEALLLELPVGDYIIVTLSDSGAGMDAETISKIFDPFFSTKGDKGTGLGLSQVYGFTKRSGGSIKVVSELGHGSKFTLYFPRYYSDVIQDEKTTLNTIAANEYGHETILIVDDEEPLCNMAGEILQEQGYRVLKALSAKEALNILKNKKVDMVFSDVIMPEMTGYELAEEIVNLYPDVIVQLTSGFNDVNNLNLNIDITSMNILTKPYSRADLLKRIRDLLDSSPTFHN